MSLEAFGVKNLRCLTDTGLVPIRPITVLVGRNSSGKSTFLRAFPLLRQSVETARNSPILWYHEKYVDLGSFLDAANNRLSEPSVTFQFQLTLPHSMLSPAIAMRLAGGETPHVSAYEISMDGHELQWNFDSHGQSRSLTNNGRAIDVDGTSSLGGKAYLLPIIHPGEPTGVSYQAAVEIARIETPDVLTFDTVVTILKPPSFHPPDAFRYPLAYAHDVLQAADIALAQIMSRVAYLAPLRVSAQRAYRIQNLAVDEVDPDGKNLAMFLRSLSPTEIESFAAFTQNALGFETIIRTTGIHAEILVREGPAKRFVNLVDVGFGYAEVLPLAAVLWASCLRPKLQGRAPAPLVAIEQPELHLHPAHQAKLARMLVEAASKSGGSKIVVETHSESLINGLGKLIYKGAVKAEDVQIVLFDKDEETEETTVSLSGYDTDGALQDNWPYGFLAPVGERLVRPAAE